MSDTQGVCCMASIKMFLSELLTNREPVGELCAGLWEYVAHRRMVELLPGVAGHGGEHVKGFALQAIKHNEAWAPRPSQSRSLSLEWPGAAPQPQVVASCLYWSQLSAHTKADHVSLQGLLQTAVLVLQNKEQRP